MDGLFICGGSLALEWGMRRWRVRRHRKLADVFWPAREGVDLRCLQDRSLKPSLAIFNRSGSIRCRHGKKDGFNLPRQTQFREASRRTRRVRTPTKRSRLRMRSDGRFPQALPGVNQGVDDGHGLVLFPHFDGHLPPTHIPRRRNIRLR